MSTTNAASAAHLDYVLRIADTSLILGQRLSEWCGHGPVIEEDIALTNVALDLIGQARLLLSHVGRLEGKGRDEDQLAFLRTEPQYRNLTIVELPNGDFARTILRNFLVAAWQRELWQKLATSNDTELAAIAAKSLKERTNRTHACSAPSTISGRTRPSSSAPPPTTRPSMQPRSGRPGRRSNRHGKPPCGRCSKWQR
jgi:ring-1,2-phenylacetyl-CoA epoxidase subunit PaaC